MISHTEKGRRRKITRERYHYECAVCGGVERLTVHHKLPAKKYGEEEAWQIYNIILLCDWAPNGCHKLVHNPSLENENLTEREQDHVELLRKLLL